MDNLNFMVFDELESVEVQIESIDPRSIDEWQVLLKSKKENIGLNVGVNIGQATDILFGMSNSVQYAVAPSMPQFIQNLCNDAKVKLVSIIVYYADEMIAKSVIKLKQCEKYYFYELSVGDAIALASILEIPIFVLKKHLEEIEDETQFVLETD